MKTKEIFEADYNFAKAKSAFIFKTIVDPFIGKYSLIKIASGVIKSDDMLYNVSEGYGGPHQQAVRSGRQPYDRSKRAARR